MVWKSTSASGAPGFSAMTRPLGRGTDITHAIEQVSRRWRAGLRDDSARTRRKILISFVAGGGGRVALGQSCVIPRSRARAHRRRLQSAGPSPIGSFSWRRSREEGTRGVRLGEAAHAGTGMIRGHQGTMCNAGVVNAGSE